MTIVPISLKQANTYVLTYHRHHKAVVGHKFSIGLTNGTPDLLGCAIVGRPVARMLDDGFTAEVTRLCTNGQENACSMLYSACRRIAKEMGYKRIGTYILESESGISLKASNWKYHHTTQNGDWTRRKDGIRNTPEHLKGAKQYWMCEL